MENVFQTRVSGEMRAIKIWICKICHKIDSEMKWTCTETAPTITATTLQSSFVWKRTLFTTHSISLIANAMETWCKHYIVILISFHLRLWPFYGSSVKASRSSAKKVSGRLDEKININIFLAPNISVPELDIPSDSDAESNAKSVTSTPKCNRCPIWFDSHSLFRKMATISVPKIRSHRKMVHNRDANSSIRSEVHRSVIAVHDWRGPCRPRSDRTMANR